MKKTFVAVAIAGALSLARFVVADPHAEMAMHHGGVENHLEHVTKELNLTPEQQAKVAPIVEQTKPQIAAIHREAMEKMRAVLENTATQIRPLLTPEQQQKLDAMKKAHEDMLKAHQEMEEARKK